MSDSVPVDFWATGAGLAHPKQVATAGSLDTVIAAARVVPIALLRDAVTMAAIPRLAHPAAPVVSVVVTFSGGASAPADAERLWRRLVFLMAADMFRSVNTAELSSVSAMVKSPAIIVKLNAYAGTGQLDLVALDQEVREIVDQDGTGRDDARPVVTLSSGLVVPS